MAASLPTLDQIEALHRKYAPADSVFDLVFTHCRIVCDIALQLARQTNANVDIELVRVGCLLHDIGVYRLYDARGIETNPELYITHGIQGEEILKNEGYSDAICRFASHHTGAGITRKQILERNLPLPAQDFIAETKEEELVMYADKFHSKTNPPYFNSHEFYTDYVGKFGEASVDNFLRMTEKFGKPNLDNLIARYGHSLRDKAD